MEIKCGVDINSRCGIVNFNDFGVITGSPPGPNKRRTQGAGKTCVLTKQRRAGLPWAINGHPVIHPRPALVRFLIPEIFMRFIGHEHTV